ncbi:hypothetical protein ACFLXU_07810, partial [Chloroflexota bacterium]
MFNIGFRLLGKERVSNPDVYQTNLTTLVAGNSEFAFNLYPGHQQYGRQPFLLASQHLTSTGDGLC